ncbi:MULTISPECIES: hypothetical protein [Flavobacterium]|uniref:Uncharacterized protein n=1 Tax=Flavobacterium supellecticarium TaxID=2565924 RepID=A0A4S4A4V6_9FLAO|nr:hypothetical protein [Flavobacterium supellecticarium]MPT33970.1 hypothetical protein [Flavobacterium sp.]THF53494.1 hypothetical protein E6C50_04640 [Flavobacterium supellecticarium]
MNRYFLTFLLCLITSLGFSQKIKLKKEKIFLDDKEFLSCEKGGAFGAVAYELSELNTNKRIIILVQNDGGTHMEIADDYTQIKFLTKGEQAEIRGGNIYNAIKLLLKNGVLTPEGTLDESQIDLFIKNYDEKISEKTRIIR